jgi:outer membrane lipoprotein-sorting protein
MWLSLLSVVFAGPGADNAEALFKKMEGPILAAKSFKTDIEVTFEATKEDARKGFKGRFLVAKGNKMRLELEGTIRDKPAKVLMVSDGMKMATAMDEGLKNVQDTEKDLGQVALASMSRTGIFAALFLIIESGKPGMKREPFELNKSFALSDFKMGKKEAVADREAQAVHYQLKARGAKEPLEVTVWIDLKTHLPIKRTVTAKEGRESMTITETYTNAALDAALADKEFTVPKEDGKK